MVDELFKLNREMNMEKYSLKQLALYFERYHGCILKITTEKRYIECKINKNSFPHLIGMQYAFKNIKGSNEYLGASGFEKIKNGEVTYEDIMRKIKNSQSNIAWTNVKNRIKYLPMFLNKLNKTKFLIKDDNLLCRKTYLKGNYFLYRSLFNNFFPILSLKSINDIKVIIETFIVDNDLSLIGLLHNEKIISLEIVPTTDNVIKEKVKT